MKKTAIKKSKEVSKKDILYKNAKKESPKRVKEIINLYSYNKAKKVDESWDFKKANTKEYTHCFHNYPAMMIPQIARRIIETYGKKSQLLFDPYCGTGTSLVEANLKGINAIGTDINPLARLIAKAKTTKLDLQVLDLFLHDFFNYLFTLKFQSELVHSLIIPKIKNIDFWFSKDVQKRLGILLEYIEKINDQDIKNFFKVAFSETVRESSFVKQSEFKLVRNKNFKLQNDIDVFDIMISKLARNKQGMIEFEKFNKNISFTNIYDFNTVFPISTDIIKPNTIDIVLTSPPYGDSKTTVAYGQYSRLANEWLGCSDANQVDNLLMGGKKHKYHHNFKSEVLNDVLLTIKSKDQERARDVISFYEDYENSINNVSATIRKGGFACYVVGNRTVKGITIPNDEITKNIFLTNGFEHIDTIIRNIPNKRMPLKNSPSNIVGETSSTMKNEYIVICRKK